MRIQVTIPVTPAPKLRPRAMVTRTGKVHVYTPKKTAHAEAVIRSIVAKSRKCFPRDEAVRLEATFYLTRPGSIPRKRKLPVVRPDLDNYWKSLTDALQGLAYEDDAQITSATLRKRYGSPARIELTLDSDGNGD